MRATMWALVVLAALFAGCAFLKSISRTATVGAAAGGGAVLGSVGGPVGTFAGGLAGGGAAYAVMENSELRSGSLQGAEARDAELDRLKSMLIIVRGDLSAKEIALTTARNQVEKISSYSESLKKTWMWVLVIGLVTRNLHNFPPLARALLARRWLKALHWLAHMIVIPGRPSE